MGPLLCRTGYVKSDRRKERGRGSVEREGERDAASEGLERICGDMGAFDRLEIIFVFCRALYGAVSGFELFRIQRFLGGGHDVHLDG